MPQIVQTLTENGINAPTPIQQLAIPEQMKTISYKSTIKNGEKINIGKNVLLAAQTGTGKTLAY